MAKKKTSDSVTVVCPMGGEPTGYISNRIDVRLTHRQSLNLRRCFDGLHSQHAKLADGTHIDSANDAIRWMLEQLEPEAAASSNAPLD